MNEEIFNMQLRKFLKTVGVTSQREIETAVRKGLLDGKLAPNQPIIANITLRVPSLGLEKEISGEIKLS